MTGCADAGHHAVVVFTMGNACTLKESLLVMEA
jgi:hypothetical protein